MKRTIILATAIYPSEPPWLWRTRSLVRCWTVTDSKIVVQKGKEKWELTRDANTKVTGDIQKGTKVTVQYNKTATSIEAKGALKAKAKGKEKSMPVAAGAPAAK